MSQTFPVPSLLKMTSMGGAVERLPLTASLLNLRSRHAVLPCLPDLVASCCVLRLHTRPVPGGWLASGFEEVMIIHCAAAQAS